MAVDVELFGGLAINVPPRQAVTLDAPIPVGEFIDRLGLDREQIGLIVIDGVQKEMNDAVPITCRLCLFPPVSGG